MIPGLKIIDDILKGLPENARLREQLGDLRLQVEKFESELKDARAEIQRFKEKYENPLKLTQESISVLQFLNSARDYVRIDDIAKSLGIDAARAEWLLEKLVESKHLFWGNPDRYRIEQKGRDVLYNSQNVV